MLLAILLVIIVTLNIYYSGKNFKQYEKKQVLSEEANIEEGEYLVYETDPKDFELTDENKYKDYDNDNLTNEKEVELGTDPFNPDTDGDGLSDGQEVNRYETDPLKWSTSGDNISDYVKVEKELDVNKMYKDDEIKFEEVQVSSNVTLIPDDVESEVKGNFKEFSYDNKIQSYRSVFSVYNFKGKIKYQLDSDEMILLTCYADKYSEFKDYSIKDNVMTINISEEDNAVDFVIVTKENYEKYQKGEKE